MAEGRRGRADPLFGVLFHRQVGQGSIIGIISLTLQVGVGDRFPDILEGLHDAAAAFRETGITDAITVGDHPAACLIDRCTHQRGGLPRDALIALAVVVGAYVEQGMILPVIPADDLGG